MRNKLIIGLAVLFGILCIILEICETDLFGTVIDKEFIESIDSQTITEYCSSEEALEKHTRSWSIIREDGNLYARFATFGENADVRCSIQILPQNSSVERTKILKDKSDVSPRIFNTEITIFKDNLIIVINEYSDFPRSKAAQRCLAEQLNILYEAYEQLK